jgi:RNA polymerase sigma-70 factor (ECF subfamily)
MMEKAQTQDEFTLVRRVARGDVAAFEVVYRRYRLRIAGFAGRLTQRPDIIEEVVNDTMVVVWQKAGRFRGRSRLSTWILGIAYRITLKRLRESSRRARAEAELPYEAQPSDLEQPEALLSRRQGQERIRQALLQLSPNHRAVIELTFFEGLSYREISEIVGCPHNTVKTRMFHARRQLKQVLEARASVTNSRRLSDVP